MIDRTSKVHIYILDNSKYGAYVRQRQDISFHIISLSEAIPTVIILPKIIREILDSRSLGNPALLKMGTVDFNSPVYTCRSANSLTNYSTIYVGLVVDCVLDSAILGEKAAELVAAWPVLGGILLKNTKPWSFTCGATVDFAARTVDQSLSSYLSLDWEYKNEPTILQTEEPSEVDKKFIFDICFNSTTIFKLRVTTLTDTTLLCFGITHHLCDGTDCYEVVQAFCNLLSNKPIPRFVLPPDAEDILLSHTMTVKAKCTEEESNIYYKNHAENLDSGIFKLGRLLWRVLLTNIAEKLMLAERLTTKFIHVPGSWVDELRAKSQVELHQSSTDIEITRNDILAAWYLKTIYSPQNSSQHSVDYYGPINYRPFISPPKAGTYYIHNSVGVIRCKFSVHQLQRESITTIARDIRRQTLLYASPASVEQYLRFSENHSTRALALSARRGGNLALVGLSQWTTFNYTDLDFSGASLQGQKATVIFVNPAVTIPFNLTVGPMIIIEKNGTGGYWIRASNTSSGWKTFSHSSKIENLFRTQ
ncbi:hypothetical protein N7495_007711 [Penicillium taxi]|uniref:uncharacterized protein n=1 Tax=Penicillium taxi TaxID=168475 RepID=UPI002545BA54|nr:uncharacterized protein N7495_007711 [Penicillium taxi]KAJ5887670.1 hypothetical protein N7495_007711 [Penicillium taxi]